jgi:hypothetical protein
MGIRPELVNLVVAGVAGVLIFSQAKVIAEALSNFRGGPRPPTHPLPSNDSALLGRRKGKKIDEQQRLRQR